MYEKRDLQRGYISKWLLVLLRSLADPGFDANLRGAAAQIRCD